MRNAPYAVGVILPLFILSLLPALLGCRTVSIEKTEPARNWTYSVRTRVTGGDAGVAGEPRLSVGQLYYDSRRIGEYFSEVVIDGTRFGYRIRTKEQPLRGYRRSEGPPAAPAIRGESLGREGRRRGWYLSAYGQRRPGTPDDWIWVRRENLSAWVNPDELEDFVEEFELDTMLAEREGSVRLRLQFTQTL